MSVKTVKTSLQAVRSVGDWARPQEPRIAGQVNSLVERWKVFENEMNAQRTNRNGPLRWEAPVRSTDESIDPVTSASQTQNTSQIQSASNVQSPEQAHVQQRIVPPTTRTVAPPVNENKAANDIVPDTEEGRAELAMYLRAHHKEVEDHRENLRRQLDRMAFRSLPKLEKHIMVNPQKLFTPTTKFKFENTPPNDKSKAEGVKQKESPAEVIAKDVIPQAPEVEAGTQAFIKSTGFQPPALEDMSKRVMTKLAAWSKSIQPPEPEPVKPLQPPTVLQVLTSKPSSAASQTTRQEPQIDTTSTPVESATTGQSFLPPLIEHLQASSANSKSSDPISPYPVVPYSVKYSLPTPSSDATILPKSRRKIDKPPMSFESSLTSIERRMDLSMTQISPSVSLQ